MAKTPEEIKPHAADYNPQAWDAYELWELGMWVHLLVKRATHRASVPKRHKDLYDAQNYLTMMQSKLDELKDDSPA